MPSLTIPESGLSLSSGKSSTKSDSQHADIVTLSLADSVIEDMIKCVRNGQSIRLSLGNNPKITYGSQTEEFTSTPNPLPCDYFRTTPSPSSSSSTTLADKMSYWLGTSKNMFRPQTVRTVDRYGVTISSRLTTPILASKMRTSKPNTPKTPSTDTSPTEGVDTALAALKSSLASEDARKRDNITKLVKDTTNLPPAVQQRGPAKPMKSGNKARFLAQTDKKPLHGNAVRSMPTSPALTGVGSPALGPTSVPFSQQQAERFKAIRRPIIHKLALGPATEDVISKYKKNDASEQEFKAALEKVADLEGGKWKLKQKAFRDLDVYAYAKYSPEERQVAIDNAIHAYDKIRLATSDPEWQRLLPFGERGAGKCLSKLQAKIAVGAIKPAKAPRIKVHGAEDSGRNTPASDDDVDDLFGEKIPIATLKSESRARSHSNPPVMKQKKTSEKELQAKRLLGQGKPNKPTSTKSSDKKMSAKDASKVKSAEFVRDSDEAEDDYLLPTPITAHSSTTSSKPNGTKIPAPKAQPSVSSTSRDEHGEMTPKLNGIHKPKAITTSPPKSSPLASSPPTNASDFEDSSSFSSASLKRKAMDSSPDMPAIKRHQKSSSSSTSSSVTSSTSTVSTERHDPIWYEIVRKDVSATKKFVIYYKRYTDLYAELAAAPDKDRDAEKMADLMNMHDRLAQMKAEILPPGEV